ncbi:hypothetical protein L2E82_18806 [Cichorium intybus]|uniref:Uncharacterized protein n=1 Tax=Cichorium intybus TaxID=13427 RepID=A0ACB9FCA8_CICIN|nr:hypothetical protein L2E82_18806 [Cichorium intybus]
MKQTTPCKPTVTNPRFLHQVSGNGWTDHRDAQNCSKCSLKRWLIGATRDSDTRHLPVEASSIEQGVYDVSSSRFCLQRVVSNNSTAFLSVVILNLLGQKGGMSENLAYKNIIVELNEYLAPYGFFFPLTLLGHRAMIGGMCGMHCSGSLVVR